MTASPSPLAALLAKHGMSIKQLANALRYSPRSIHNLSCGNSKSRTARQKICNFFQESIWGLEPTERAVVFPAGIEIDFSGHEADTREWLTELPDHVELRGTKLVFTRPAALLVVPDKAKSIFGTKKFHMPNAHKVAIRASCPEKPA